MAGKYPRTGEPDWEYGRSDTGYGDGTEGFAYPVQKFFREWECGAGVSNGYSSIKGGSGFDWKAIAGKCQGKICDDQRNGKGSAGESVDCFTQTGKVDGNKEKRIFLERIIFEFFRICRKDTFLMRYRIFVCVFA